MARKNSLPHPAIRISAKPAPRYRIPPRSPPQAPAATATTLLPWWERRDLAASGKRTLGFSKLQDRSELKNHLTQSQRNLEPEQVCYAIKLRRFCPAEMTVASSEADEVAAETMEVIEMAAEVAEPRPLAALAEAPPLTAEVQERFFMIYLCFFVAAARSWPYPE